jgi:hypothetical protein
MEFSLVFLVFPPEVGQQGPKHVAANYINKKIK